MAEKVSTIKQSTMENNAKLQGQAMENFVVMNLNGTRFEVTSEVLDKVLKSANLSRSTASKIGSEYYFNRNAQAFQMILDYFQHGELHHPQDICHNIFKRELEFWGLAATKMEDCCYRKMVSNQDDDNMLKLFNRNYIKDSKSTSSSTSNYLMPRLKMKIWRILDKPNSSRLAKVYLGISVIFVIISLFVMAAGTHPNFLRQLKTDEFEELYYDRYGKSPPRGMGPPPRQILRRSIKFNKREAPSQQSAIPRFKRNPNPHSPGLGGGDPFNNTLEDTTPGNDNQENVISEASVRISELDYMEYAVMVFFSIELLARFLVCPSKCDYMKNATNICDIIALLALYVNVIVDIILPSQRYSISLADFIDCLQTFRVFRFFRIVKDVIGFRVLVYTIKMSTKELCLLVMYLLLCVIVFSGVVYYCERDNMKSIPDAMWWVVITMTTVGYGDMYPNTFLGRVVGSLAAICGVLLIAVTIPVFVNNFILFYSYSKTINATKASKKKSDAIKRIQVQPKENVIITPNTCIT